MNNVISTSESTNYRYAFEQPGHFARGWYVVAFSQELAPGEIKALSYFNQEMVLYRGEDGVAAVLDAYCPHLGAHLAATGSKVEGNCIRCPFHGWQYDNTGKCVDIPYASKIPERAVNALKGWQVVEQSGYIAVWYDPFDIDMKNGAAPEFELPVIEEWNTDGWTDWAISKRRLKAHGREVIENVVDNAHFAFVHGGDVEKFRIEFTDYTVAQHSTVKSNANNAMIIPSDSAIPPDMLREMRDPDSNAWGIATYHGPAVMYYYTECTAPDMAYKSWWVNYHTPINNDEIDLISGVMVASLDERPLPQEFLEMYPLGAHTAFGQDAEIWRTKVYRSDPILCDGDGPINKLRKWYEKFYLPLA